MGRRSVVLVAAVDKHQTELTLSPMGQRNLRRVFLLVQNIDLFAMVRILALAGLAPQREFELFPVRPPWEKSHQAPPGSYPWEESHRQMHSQMTDGQPPMTPPWRKRHRCSDRAPEVAP